jgi:4'-phosphopantetheinyl transferase
MLYHSLKKPSTDLNLPAGEIHIWLGVLDQLEYGLNRFMQTLSTDEHRRAARFHFREDRQQFIARHGMLRMLLGCYQSVKPGDLRFYDGKNGKPKVANFPDKRTIHFNLSHSEGVALFAFARNHEIGVDLERIREIPEMEQIVDRFFSAREKTFFRALPQDMKRDAFLNCWTRKEAFIKAIGEGLSWPLDTCDVASVPGKGDASLLRAGGPGEVPAWSLHTFRPAREFVGALAVKCNGFRLRYFKWTAATIMSQPQESIFPAVCCRGLQ